MRLTAVVRRLLVQLSGVRASDVKSGQLVPAQWKSLEWAASHLATLPIHLTNARSVEELRDVAASIPGLGKIAVDYLQLMKTSIAGESKRNSVEAVSDALKALAVDFDVPVLCLSSLRRLAKQKDGTHEKPDMSDLRESGSLEYDGDIVMLMTRDFDSDLCELVLAKNRDGRVGKLQLRFRGELMRFEEMPS
jgi:replicative DNA helicase